MDLPIESIFERYYSKEGGILLYHAPLGYVYKVVMYVQSYQASMLHVLGIYANIPYES